MVDRGFLVEHLAQMGWRNRRLKVVGSDVGLDVFQRVPNGQHHDLECAVARIVEQHAGSSVARSQAHAGEDHLLNIVATFILNGSVNPEGPSAKYLAHAAGPVAVDDKIVVKPKYYNKRNAELVAAIKALRSIKD